MEREQLARYSLTEFDRDVHKGLDYMSGSVGGFSFYKKRDLSIKFYKFVFEKVKENRHAVDWGKTYKKVYHKIIIPNSFMERLEKYSIEHYKTVRCESDCKKKCKK